MLEMESHEMDYFKYDELQKEPKEAKDNLK